MRILVINKKIFLFYGFLTLNVKSVYSMDVFYKAREKKCQFDIFKNSKNCIIAKIMLAIENKDSLCTALNDCNNCRPFLDEFILNKNDNFKNSFADYRKYTLKKFDTLTLVKELHKLKEQCKLLEKEVIALAECLKHDKKGKSFIVQTMR